MPIDREFLIRQATVFVLAALVAAFLSYALFIRKPPPIPGDALALVHPRFHTARAMADLRALVEECPARVTGSEGGRCAARLIESRFREAGLATSTQQLPLWLRGKQVEGTNVLARIPGTSSPTLLLMAHYDAPPNGGDAASDNGTGVAALLELARVFSQEKPARTIILAATDAGFWSALGAVALAREKAWEDFSGQGESAPYAALSLDHLPPGTAGLIALQAGSPSGAHAPVWIRARVAEAIASGGLRVRHEGLLPQIASRAVPHTSQDQGPMLGRGIPAVNLAALPAPGERARPAPSAGENGAGDIRPGALLQFGSAAELAARGLLMARVTGSPDAITLSPSGDLPRETLRWMAALLFLPLAVLVLDALRRRKGAFRATLLDAAQAAAWTLPLLLALLALRLCVRLEMLPRFSGFPAALRDPLLTAWAPLPMAAVAATIILGALAAAALSPRTGREAGFVLLLGASIWAWTLNDLSAALFLGPAAWAWPWIGAGGGKRGRWLDALLLFIGVAPLAALLCVAGARLLLGPWILWYGPLLAGYGVLGLPAACATALAFAAAVAFSRSASDRRLASG